MDRKRLRNAAKKAIHRKVNGSYKSTKSSVLDQAKSKIDDKFDGLNNAIIEWNNTLYNYLLQLNPGMEEDIDDALLDIDSATYGPSLMALIEDIEKLSLDKVSNIITRRDLKVKSL